VRVLLTGGAGFIGSHVAESFGDAGHEVRVLDILTRGSAPPSAPGDWMVGDVRDPSVCDAVLAGVDAVCHQAAKVGLGVDAQDLPDYASVNDVGTTVLLAAMDRAGVGRLVLASSMVVYGDGAYLCEEHGRVRALPRAEADLARGVFDPACPRCGRTLVPTVVDEDDPLDPRNAYATSKLAQEHYSAAWARQTGGTVTALRYHNVYGPRMPRDTPYAGVAAIFRSVLANGHAPRVFEDGGQRRDFVHVRDVAAANLAALRTPPAEGVLRAYNVGSGRVRTVGDMAAALAAACDGPAPVVTGEYRLGDVRHITASSERAGRELGWGTAVAFEDGMAELLRDGQPVGPGPGTGTGTGTPATRA
jgi:dTDP-L-rhamnose 4-epimerase